MKILYVTSNSPFNSHSGSHQRTALLLDAISSFAEVHVVCFDTHEDLLSRFDKDGCKVIYFGPCIQLSNNKIQQILKRIIRVFMIWNPYFFFQKNKYASKILYDVQKRNSYDYIIVRYLSFAGFCGLEFNKKLIIDVDDLPEQVYASNLNNNKYNFFKWVYCLLNVRFARYHTNIICMKIFHSFFPNNEQNKYSNSSYLPNIPFKYPQKIESINLQKPVVLFVGIMSWEPNSTGVDSFVNNCWPQIKEKVPEAIFRIVGKGVSQQYYNNWIKNDGIEILGFVDDLNLVYNESSVVIAPIYSGAGTNIKVLEGMSYSRPLVISTFASRGFEEYLINGKNIMIASSFDDFISKTVLLLKDIDLNKIVGSNGCEVVNHNFTNTRNLEIISSVFK